MTAEEGLCSLNTLTLHEVTINNLSPLQQIPEPSQQNKKMLEALGIELPKIFLISKVHVSAKKIAEKPT